MASNYRTGSVRESLPLYFAPSTEVSGLYIQCKIYDKSDVLIETVNLTESALQAGRYIGSVTLDVEGYYEAFYIAYTDSGHTTESEMVGRSSEAITMRVSSDVFGGGGGKQSNSTIIDTKTIAEDVANYLIKHFDVWKVLLKNGKTAEDELIGKSEFNVKKDLVKTEFNLNELKPKDYSQELIKKLSKLSNSITSLEQKSTKDDELHSKSDLILQTMTSLQTLGKKLQTHDEQLQTHENNLTIQVNDFIKRLGIVSKEINSGVSVLNDLKDINNGVRSMERIEKLKEIVIEIKEFIKRNQQLLYNLDQLQLDRFNNLSKLLSKGVPIRKV